MPFTTTRWWRTTKLGVTAIVVSLSLPAVSAAAQAKEDAKPAAQILMDAVTVTRQLPDFHVVGHASAGGINVGFNMSISRHGGGGSLTETGARFDLVTTRHFSYMKAGAASWKALLHSSAGAGVLAGRWLKVKASDAEFASLSQLTFSGKFLNLLLDSPGQLKKLGMSAVDGRSAIVLGNDLGNRYYVAAYRHPYLLEFTSNNPSASETLHVTDFGDAPMPHIPLSALTVPGS